MDWDWTKVTALPNDPDKIPIGFRLFCGTLLEIPEEFHASLYPDPKLSAEQFLNIALPRQSHQLPQVHADMCFTSLPVNTNPEQLRNRVLPPLPCTKLSPMGQSQSNIRHTLDLASPMVDLLPQKMVSAARHTNAIESRA